MKGMQRDLNGRQDRNRSLWIIGTAVILVATVWASGLGRWITTAISHELQQNNVNRTLPHFTPPATELSFSETPGDTEFLRTGLFAEPLVPVAATTAQENRDLAKAVLAYRDNIQQFGSRDAVQPLLDFLTAHPNSAWKPVLELDLGIAYRQTGHFSKALEIWQAGWSDTENLNDPHGRVLGDAMVARLSQMEAYLGRIELLQPLLDSIRKRPVHGTAAEILHASFTGLSEMLYQPGKSFKCGPMALMRILTHSSAKPSQATLQVLEQSQSTDHGLSLTAVQGIAAKAGMQYQMAFRNPGAPIVIPAVAHWKVGHYAAIVDQVNGRYAVQDSTFGDDIRVSPKTLDEEASGYFLVPAGPLPQGWRSVAAAEGDKIWGRGNTGNGGDPGGGGPGGPAGGGPPPPCSDGPPPPPPPPGSPPSSPLGSPCTTWTVELEVVGLQLHDTPVGYTPPIGPEVHFDLYYSHRDVQQPVTFSYINFGPKWTFTWLSYITDNVNSSASATLYQRGGGSEPYTFSSDSATTAYPGPFSQAILTRTTTGGNSTGFTLQNPDGSFEQYNQAVGNQFFMTAVADRMGNKVTLSYDSQMRIVAITDAIGQVSTLSYNLPGQPLVVTQITDPFGRSASFTYNANGQLASITDILGITSSYAYTSGTDFVNTLTTPYGTSTFSYGDSTTISSNPNDTVYLKSVDPLGRVSYVEFDQNIVPGDSNSSGSSTKPVPSGPGLSISNSNLFYRNTFVFDANQYQMAIGSSGCQTAYAGGACLNYSMAHVIHWLHSSDEVSRSRVMESEKQPLENRVWYNYAAQPNPLFFGVSSAGVVTNGASNRPIAIARVLDSGATQLQLIQYNANGNLIQATDPIGRQTSYTYAANGTDLLAVSNTTTPNAQILKKYTYNSQHEPLTITGANGTTASYLYNLQGQSIQYTDPLGNRTTYNYNGRQYLNAVQGPIADATYTYTYDNVGRIASATDPGGSTVNYTYDAADRPTSATFPDGTSSTWTYNLLDLATTTDRLGQTTRYSYDADRELTQIVDPLGQTVTMGYNPAGKLDSITDPDGHATTLTLDAQGRVIAKQFADGTTQNQAYENSISLLARVTDALGQVTTYTYNTDNTRASINYVNPINLTASVAFAYDPAYSRLISMSDGIGTTTYTYYPVESQPFVGANQLRSVTSPIAGGSGGSDTVSYTYDALNRVVGRSINGIAQSTTFDALGRVTAESNPLDAFTYSYTDGTSRLTNVNSGKGPTLAMDYYGPEGDELLQQTDFSTRSGTSLAQFGYTYNSDDNVTSFTQSYLNQNPALIAATGGSSGITGSLVASLFKGGSVHWSAGGRHYSFSAISGKDVILVLMVLSLSGLGWVAYRGGWRWRTAWAALPAGMVVLVLGCSGGGGGDSSPGRSSISLNGVGPTLPSISGQVANYAYDTANRLLSALVGTTQSSSSSGSGPSTPQFVYGYDPASNLTSITPNGPQQFFTYTATNAITSGAYDANGNLAALGSNTYTWDGANRIVSFSSGANQSNFVYDGKSRLVRIIEQQNGQIVADRAYFWCGNVRCLAHDNTRSGSPVSTQYFSQGVIAGETSYYYVTDRLGSVRQLVDASGNVAVQYDYDSYGNPLKISGSVDADFGYAGYFHHAASGLDFALYRAYDPANARWLNRDPIEEAGGVNLYAYVGGNPTSLIDPRGLAPGDTNGGPTTPGNTGQTGGGELGSYGPQNDSNYPGPISIKRNPPDFSGKMCSLGENSFCNAVKEKICRAAVDFACGYAPGVCCQELHRHCVAHAADDPLLLPRCEAENVSCMSRSH